MSNRPRPQHLPGKLLAVRRHLKLSQTQMVTRLGLGLHYSRISEFEIGRRFPPIHVLLAYARVAGVTIDALVDDTVSLFEKGGAQ
jgi:transcriptional regulator with XRE-family HTH domain